MSNKKEIGNNMETIKIIIKSILGDFIICKLIILKNHIIPSEKYKQELEMNNKRKSFYSQFIKKDDLCFDIGANVGNRVFPLLALNAKVVAVEPQKSCRNILKAKFGNKIKIVPLGLGEKEEEKDFFISNASVISSFSEEWINSVKQMRFKEYNWNTVQKVRMTTLDRLIENYGTPDFIKIDVEGYELEVLKGLSKPIYMISFEYTTPEQINKAIDCIKRIININSHFEFNYSIGETMEFALNKWLSVDEIEKLIESKIFIETGFGDIYARNKDFHRLTLGTIG